MSLSETTKCRAGGVFYTTTWTTLILPKGVALVQRVDGRGEERSDLYYGGTHVRYIYYIVHDVMWYCTVVT